MMFLKNMQEEKKKKIWKVLAFFMILTTGMSMSACTNQEKRTEKGNTFKIVTSFYPLYIMAINLTDGVSDVEVENMASPQTGCLHDYQLRPKDLVCLEDADLFLANGGGMESFLNDVLNTYPELSIIYAMDNVDGKKLLPGNKEDDGANPHTWMDMDIYVSELAGIKDVLSEKDPDHAGEYAVNFEIYSQKINSLKEEYKVLEKQEKTMNCILLHESFAYLAEEWNYPVTKIVDVEKDSGFSAKEIKELINEVEDIGDGMIISDVQYSGQIASLLSEETEFGICRLDSCVSGKYEKDAYINSMKMNLEELEHAAN